MDTIIVPESYATDIRDVEHALQHGCLWIKTSRNRYWRLRRNGCTKTWKRDLNRFRIPVKAGLYVYSAVTNDTVIGDYDSGKDIIFATDDDIAQIQK
jgi:hypothetical protein